MTSLLHNHADTASRRLRILPRENNTFDIVVSLGGKQFRHSGFRSLSEAYNKGFKIINDAM